MPSGLVSNIQKYSLQDGPGIRTTVFLKGCPLRCAWCYNPENISSQPQVLVFKTRCVRCGACREVCPQWKAFRREVANRAGEECSITPSGALGEVARCLVCGACVEACPTGARVMVGQPVTVDELMAELMTDRIFYDDSGGGVTFSGGEPLRQAEFLQAALTACRARGLHTAVDTCGWGHEEELRAIAPLVDLFLYDLKFMDERRHLEFCGVSTRLILDNLRALAASHKNIWIRVPIIPGVNDAPSELDAMAVFVATLPGVRQVNLLPYHRSGLHKFEQLGQECRLASVIPPSQETMQAVAACFAAAGVTAKSGG